LSERATKYWLAQQNFSQPLSRAWRKRGPLAQALLPVAYLFAGLAALRRHAYRSGWLSVVRLPVPVVVVGNIVAGGSGKTPLTLWLATRLKAAGHNPGIVSRGYGRQDTRVKKVDAGGTASDYGDEPLLLAQRSACPVYVGADRVAAAQALLAARPECDVILCDDGLQHYRLGRDVEIAVVDRRGFMNAWPLPAGPLREPPSRLKRVDALVLHDNDRLRVNAVPSFCMRLKGGHFYQLGQEEVRCGADRLVGLRLHAVAGIGEPQRFFDHLAALGLVCEPHAFPDHHFYVTDDLAFTGDAILTTEKDALKFRELPVLPALPVWVLPVDAEVEPDLVRFVMEKIHGCPPA